MQIYNYNSTIPHYDALILTMGGSAFEINDYSFDVTKNLLDNTCSHCKALHWLVLLELVILLKVLT